MHMFFNALKDLFLHMRHRNELFDIGCGKARYEKINALADCQR